MKPHLPDLTQQVCGLTTGSIARAAYRLVVCLLDWQHRFAFSGSRRETRSDSLLSFRFRRTTCELSQTGHPLLDLAVSFQFAIASLLPNYLSWHPKER